MASLVADYSDSESENESSENKDKESDIRIKEEPESEDVPKSKPESGDVPKSKPESEDVPKSKPESEDVPKSKPESEDVPKSKPESEDVPKSKPESEDGPKSKPESEDVPKSKPESEDGPKSTNFFETQDTDSDDEADSKNFVKSEPSTKLPNPLVWVPEKLPSILEASTSRIGTSVFMNPFEEAEQAKNQILEKHVKLTQAAPKKPAHQPICWKFKKGKCHLGKNCRFFHDMENRSLEENRTAAAASLQAAVNAEMPPRPTYHPAAYVDARRRPMEAEPEDDDNYMANMKKKKRYGVADNLVPPKKAFESLQRQREKERPWTMNSMGFK
ncbi:thioredoxin domain-containing protein 2-like [Physella acuta]|uniref:thioredoxin domain-containing protein 2-like n=1 Tax=Physella acuta TaxID=109671 RepID=UPI0027DBDA1F|nr:thioredoxin domain-containing protein 2-like [Physella acuta]